MVGLRRSDLRYGRSRPASHGQHAMGRARSAPGWRAAGKEVAELMTGACGRWQQLEPKWLRKRERRKVHRKGEGERCGVVQRSEVR